MDNFSGSFDGKNKARKLTHTLIASLNLDNYFKGNHLYLAGPESGDINEALIDSEEGDSSCVQPNQVFAAERERGRWLRARGNTVGRKDQIHHGCIVDYAKILHYKGIPINVLFPDICGTLATATSVLFRIYPYISQDCTIAINISSRDGNMEHRAQCKGMLSPAYQDTPYKFIALGLQANQAVNDLGIYFSTVLSYTNTGIGKKVGVPMTTLIGRKSKNRPPIAEPAYAHRLNAKGDIEYSKESKVPSVSALKAWLPSCYKAANLSEQYKINPSKKLHTAIVEYERMSLDSK